MFCGNHAVNYRQQVPSVGNVLDPLSHPAEPPQLHSGCEIMQRIVVQKKGHSMEMWAGTNRIGFDSLDSFIVLVGIPLHVSSGFTLRKWRWEQGQVFLIEPQDGKSSLMCVQSSADVRTVWKQPELLLYSQIMV